MPFETLWAAKQETFMFFVNVLSFQSYLTLITFTICFFGLPLSRLFGFRTAAFNLEISSFLMREILDLPTVF